MLTVLYNKQVLASGVPSFLFICGVHITKFCGGSQIYIIFSLVYILARVCLLHAYSIQNMCWLLGFRVSYLFVVVTKPKSISQDKVVRQQKLREIFHALLFTFPLCI